MNTYKIAEMFSSINGEGTHAGQLAFFVRFTGCNLDCSYCDTKWANVQDAEHTEMTGAEILSAVQKSGIRNVTVTGGEPLIQPNIVPLLETLCGDGRYVEIETNGSADVSEVVKIKGERPALTMDYKLPSSGMESRMRTENFALLEAGDTVKFVSGSCADLERALEIIREYGLIGKCAVYLSPVFGRLEPAEIVDFMLSNKLNGVNVQLQMHKFIWGPNMKGV